MKTYSKNQPHILKVSRYSKTKPIVMKVTKESRNGKFICPMICVRGNFVKECGFNYGDFIVLKYLKKGQILIKKIKVNGGKLK